MPIQRITESGELENVYVDSIVRTQADREAALLAEAQRNREAAGYAGLVRAPRSEPMTAQEAEMAEKTQEQIDRESIHTSGERFNEMQRQQEEKLAQENAITAHAGVTKVGDGLATRLIPTPENYALEPGERSEGVPSTDLPPLAIGAGVAGVVGRNAMDEAELKLRTGEQGSESSAQHATGTSTATPNLAQPESLEPVQPRSDEELEQFRKQADEVAAEAAAQDREENPKPEGDTSGGKFDGTADELGERYTAAELKAEAERRQLTVERADGKAGEPVKADYAQALASRK